MDAQQPPEWGHYSQASGSGQSSVSTLPAVTMSPEFHQRIISILSKTANGCLQELNYHPNMSHEMVELKAVVLKLQEENRKLYEDNHKLVNIAKELRAKTSPVPDAFQQFHNNRVRNLEHQIAALQAEKQHILAREQAAATGHLDYAKLHNDYVRKCKECDLLTRQISDLKGYILEKPGPLVLSTPSPMQMAPNQSIPSMTGQRIPHQQNHQIPRSAQEPLEMEHQRLLARGQVPVPTYNGQPQPIPKHTRPAFVIPHPSQPSNQVHPNNYPGHLNGVPVLRQHATQVPRVPQPSIPVPSGSRPSSSSSSRPHSEIPSDINATQAFKPLASRVSVHGWSGGSVAHPSQSAGVPGRPPQTQPGIINHLPPRRQGSAPSAFPGYVPQLQPHQMQPPQPLSQYSNSLSSAPPHSTTSPVVPAFPYPGPILSPTMANPPAVIPVVNPPHRGMPTVAIGPSGNFLPPLAAYMPAPTSISNSASPSVPPHRNAPSSRPPSRPTSRATSPQPQRRPSQSTTPSQPIDPTSMSPSAKHHEPQPLSAESTSPNASVSEIRSPSLMRRRDHSNTPHLTPSSSRASVGPSEGTSEVNTPLDLSLNDMASIVEAPLVESPLEAPPVPSAGQTPALATVAPSSLMKRDSSHIDTDSGVDIPLADLMRKKPRLSEEDASQPHIEESVTAKATPSEAVPTPMSVNDILDTRALVEEATESVDEDDDDDEEEEELGPDGTRSIQYCLDGFTDEDGLTCRLCLVRYQKGVISESFSFTPDTPQEERVQHFLEHHPSSWDNILHGRM